MQIDHSQVDKGENPHSHTGGGGVPIHQHLCIAIEGTAEKIQMLFNLTVLICSSGLVFKVAFHQTGLHSAHLLHACRKINEKIPKEKKLTPCSQWLS